MGDALLWSADHDTWGSLRPKFAATGTSGGDDNYWLTMSEDGSDGTSADTYWHPDATFCPIRFQGQWEDAETGMFYNRFRYFEPTAGQYLSADPVGPKGGPNLHGYVPFPTNWVDPVGLTGVYIFRTNAGTCYIGKGPDTRFTQSQIQRTGEDASRDPANQGDRSGAEHARASCCAARHWDLAANAAGVTTNTLAQMVENQLMALTGAVLTDDFANVKFDGQSAFANNPGAQGAATAEAQAIMRDFDDRFPGHGCW